MITEILTSKPGTINMDTDSTLYKGIEHIMYRAMHAEKGQLQEIFDVFYEKEEIRNALIGLSNSKKAVTIENKNDFEQVYIKGLIEGMHTMFLLTMINYSAYKGDVENG